MIPVMYRRELAKRFVARDEAGARLSSASKEAEKQGMITEPKVASQLAHLHERYKRSEQDLKMFLCHIAANPKWYGECVMWMVDVQGVMEGDVKDFTDPVVSDMATTDPESFKEKLLDAGGSQMKHLNDVLVKKNLRVTDKQISQDNRWVLGCPCTDEEANMLCNLVYEDYADEVEMGIITIRRMPWNIGIVGMTSAAEAREWLRQNPET